MGFRGSSQLGAVAGADIFQVSLTEDSGAPDSHLFVLPDPTLRWRFYQLFYTLWLGLEGHATLISHSAARVLLIDSPEALPAAWQVQLGAVVEATEAWDDNLSGVGFDLPGGLVFPRGDNVKLKLELAGLNFIWASPAASAYSALVTVVAKAED